MMKGLKVEASSQTWKLYKARFTYNVRPRFWIMLLVASQQAHGKILISPIMQIAQITAYKSGMFQGFWEGKKHEASLNQLFSRQKMTTYI